MSKLNKIFLMVLLLMFISFSAWAATLIIEWDANTELDIAGYEVYVSNIQYVWGNPLVVIPSLITICTVTSVLDGTYWVAVTAYDYAGNISDKSDAVRAVVDSSRPNKPGRVKVTIMR